jgi:undecaprenyl-phosphate 4-deoxy-4-formamido-L-arabinose transferase
VSPQISVVVPVFNEEHSLPLLFERLFPALDNLQRGYEILFVDDGSRDGTAAVLRQVVDARPNNVKALILAHNVGQHLAILAGFEQALGAFVVTLDADLQNPPEEIATLVHAFDAGADYVGSIRELRKDVWWRKAASGVLNRVRAKTTGIQITDQGCMLRGYDRRIVDAVNRCREVSPYLPALAYTFARRPVEVRVKHERRAVGDSRYSVYRLLRLNLDLMTGYSVIPLQLFSICGISIACSSLLFVLFLAIRRLIAGPEADGLFTLFGVAFFLLGFVLFGLGIVGEYIGRIFEQVRGRPRYIVAEMLGGSTLGEATARPDAAAVAK